MEILHVEHQGASEDTWRKEQFGIQNWCHGILQGNIWRVRKARAGNEQHMEQSGQCWWGSRWNFLHKITHECVKTKAWHQQISLCMCKTGLAVEMISVGSRLQCFLVRSSLDCLKNKTKTPPIFLNCLSSMLDQNIFQSLGFCLRPRICFLKRLKHVTAPI